MIDEKKLIENIEKLKEEAGTTYPYMEMVDGAECALDDVLGIVEDMPKVAEWIPVSERLPEDLVAVNVTWINREPKGYYEHIKDKPFVDTAMRFKGKWYWWSSPLKDCLCEYGEYHYDLIDDAIEITAWQPLPEPREGEEK